jgi:hypothetical protein
MPIIKQVLGRWTGEGSTNSYPRVTTDDTNKNCSFDFNLQREISFRFKTIQLGYSLPSDFVNRISLQKLDFYVTGGFVEVYWFDPEVGGPCSWNGQCARNVEQRDVPQVKSYMLGVNLQF